MARKKRKAAKSPPPVSRPVPLAETGGSSAWLLPALGVLTLILAWLAALGGFSDGTADFRTLFHIDSAYPRLQFHAFFGGADESAWVSTGPAPYFVPDMLMTYGLAALGVSYAASLYLISLLQAALSAAGWILVCDFLFGKSPSRRAAVLALHSLPFLIVGWRGADIFHILLQAVYHYGAWAAVPWLLWLSLRVLEPGEKRRDAPLPAGLSAWLFALLSVMVASDLFVGVWFVAPMGAVVVLLAWSGRMARGRAARFVGLLAAASAVGIVAFKVIAPTLGLEPLKGSPLEFNAEKFLRALTLTARHFWHGAIRNPAEAAVWLAFSALAFWRGMSVLRPSLRRNLPPPLAVANGLRHSVAALFVPGVMLSTIALATAAGLALDSFAYLNPETPLYSTVGGELRYFLPMLFFPLFVGWALLPGWRFRPAALCALAACAALAAPKAARIDLAALNPYGTPFYQCFAKNAQRLNWRSGIGALGFSTIFTQTPGVGDRADDGGRELFVVPIRGSRLWWWTSISICI